jgi:GTP cyclohydrolase FolE2
MLGTEIWKSSQSPTSLENEMQKYECIRGVVTSLGPIAVGDIVSLPAEEAVVLMAHGKLKIAEDTVRVAAAPKVEHRDPVIKGSPKNGR